MDSIEVRDLDEARRYVAEGLLLQRSGPPTAITVRPALEWAMEIAAGGQPLPPTGFVADIGHIAMGLGSETRAVAGGMTGYPADLALRYEDHVLGKLYADWTFERAGDALRLYTAKERTRGLAFVVNRVRERFGSGGVLLPPAVIRGLLTVSPEEVLATAWEGFSRDGPLPLLIAQYTALIDAGRRAAEVLGPEDVTALEHKTALADLGQYVAHRQILRCSNRFEEELPRRPVPPRVGRREVPTRVHDEDQYPVGGYTSIATRGSIESLLHSQLAYIEPEGSGPDLFDVKFARDELFYYSRDENQFLRRRRTFVFLLFPDLIAARCKDPELPYQRIVLIQSTILTLVHKLTEWLSADAIRFEFRFIKQGDRRPLAEEATLTEILFREEIARKDATVADLPDRAAATALLADLARSSQVHCLAVATQPFEWDVPAAVVTELVVAGAMPVLTDATGDQEGTTGEDAFDSWRETILRILRLWV